MGAVSDMLLYGAQESGHSYKIKLLLTVGGVAHRYETIDLWQPREARSESFRAHSKFDEVPVLVHGDQTLVQSNAILLYLAEHMKAFGGESAERMNRSREWLFWEANRIGISLPHLRFARQFAPEQYSEGTVAWLKRRYDADIDRLDQEFADGRRFVLGEQASIADFALCGYMFWPDQVAVTYPNHVNRWLDNIRALPGWQHPDELMRA